MATNQIKTAVVKSKTATYQNGQNKNDRHIKSEVKMYLVSEQEWNAIRQFRADYWTLLRYKWVTSPKRVCRRRQSFDS